MKNEDRDLNSNFENVPTRKKRSRRGRGRARPRRLEDLCLKLRAMNEGRFTAVLADTQARVRDQLFAIMMDDSSPLLLRWNSAEGLCNDFAGARENITLLAMLTGRILLLNGNYLSPGDDFVFANTGSEVSRYFLSFAETPEEVAMLVKAMELVGMEVPPEYMEGKVKIGSHSDAD